MKKKKIITMILAATIASNSIAPIWAFADTNNLNKVNTDKEEVIYINLNNDGTVEGAYAVNIFDNENVVDYGDYVSIRNMNTVDELEYNDGQVTGTNSADKLYYEGVLENIEIPWNIELKYYLDGKEVTSNEIAGKSGALEIKLDISENKKCDSSFFENYALQTTLLLDSDKCKNIKTDGATIANVGSDKQLSYIILAGKGAEISIKADVEDFEMDSIAINGVKLNLNVDVDNKELMDNITELQNAISEVNSGASLLSDGTVTLKDGAGELNNGITSLDSGINSLNTGITQVEDALKTLNSKSGSLVSGSSEVSNALNQISDALNDVNVSSENISALVEASSSIQGGIDSLVQGIADLQASANYEAYKNLMLSNGADIDLLQNSNASTSEALKNQIAMLQANKEQLLAAGMEAADQQIITIDTQIELFTQLITLLQGNNVVMYGTESYLNSISNGTSNLLSGATELQVKYAEFNKAIENLTTTLNGLVYNMSTLSSAINTLVTEYSALDQGINDYTNAVQALLNGYSQVVNGATTLVNSTSELKSGAETLVSGTETLADKTTELSEGTTELNNQTSDLDTQVTDKINNMVDELSGNSDEVISFVSNKNTNVKSVQFVIKTPEIQKEEVEYTETAEESLTLWEKILNLFK